MKKIMVMLLCMAMLLCLLSGCRCERGATDPTEVTEATEEITEEATDEDTLLPIEEGLDMLYATGAGAWGTNINLKADGSFTGTYHDSEMGLTGDGYDMTVVECDFWGSFTDIEKIEDYAYKMKLDKLETKIPVGKSEIEDWGDTKVRILYEDAFGIAGGDEFILYLPTAPIKELDEEFLWWNPTIDESDSVLGTYGLYNINESAGFFNYD